MQITECLELDETIRYLRTSHYHSPSFHDLQDSEIDRLYYYTPTILSPLSQPSSFSEQEEDDDEDEVDLKEEKDQNNEINGKETMLEGIIPLHTKEEKEIANFTPLSFQKVPIIQEEKKSLLKELLTLKVNEKKTPTMMPLTIVTEQPIATLQMCIYLPNKMKMAMTIYEVSTVEETIEFLLKKHEEMNLKPELYYHHPECYELRLHDSEGFPDEDFPALDRSRRIKNFGDAGGHEYCLCEKPDMCPPVKHRSSDGSSSSLWRRSTDKGILKVIMPNKNYSLLKVEETTNGKDLLPNISRKHNIPFDPTQYIFVLFPEDRERIGRSWIDMETNLKEIGIQEVYLVRKHG